MSAARATAGGFDRVLDAIPPAAGAEVMGTGIVSVALSLDHHETLSRILLVIAALMWVTLAVLVPIRARRDRARFLADIQTPPALTSVAGTAVLGTRLALLGWTWAGIAALVLAGAIWALLLGPVLGHWRTPTVGASLILTVSTESLAVLAATIALVERTDWLLVAALAPFVLGLCFYLFVIARSRRAPLVDRVPVRHVRRLQLRRRGGRARECDHKLRSRVGVDRARGVGGRARGDDQSRRPSGSLIELVACGRRG